MSRARRFLSLILLLVVCACAGSTGGLYSMSAPPGTRVINIRHKYSGEKFDGVFAKDGKYDRAAFEKLAKLFRDRETGEVHEIDPKLIEVMYSLINALALPPGTEVLLTSGFRSPGRQAELAQRNENFARRSFHTSGQAADLKIPDVSGKAVATVAQTLQDGGVAYYPKTGHIHVDVGAIRTWTPK